MFFCGAESDDIAHLLVCDAIRRLLIECLGGDFQFSLSQQLLLRSNEMLVVELFIFLLFIIFKLHNFRRHGEVLPRRLFCNVCKQASLHCKHVRSMFHPSVRWKLSPQFSEQLRTEK